MEDLLEIAEKIAAGFTRGDTSITKLNIDHAEAQRIYREIKKINKHNEYFDLPLYEGGIVLFICYQLFNDIVGETRKVLRAVKFANAPAPSLDNFYEAIVSRRQPDLISKPELIDNKEACFCALIGSIMKAMSGIDDKEISSVYTELALKLFLRNLDETEETSK